MTFADRSGAHFNPIVTLALAMRGDFPRGRVAAYVIAQFLGAGVGVVSAHAMFDLTLLQHGITERAGIGQWISEAIATFGLVLLVLSLTRRSAWAAPFAVGAYIAAAYWFTASTSFANPAVTLARGFTDTFAGIGISNVPAFVMAQLLGGGLALLADKALMVRDKSR